MSMPDQWLRNLTESLTVLAADSGRQLSYLDDLGISGAVDELALTLYDLVLGIDERLKAGVVTRHQADCIKDLDTRLDAMSGIHKAALWTPEGLRKSKEWAEIRQYAASCLRELGIGLPPK